MNTRHSTAFSLVELLVVITIIVVLLAMLTPALDKAVESASTARCLANHHVMANAMSLLLSDQRQRYPQLVGYVSLLGDNYNNPTASPNVKARPLNAYLGYTNNGSRVPVAQCPSDLGDALSTVNSYHAYKSWGSSYLAAYSPAGPGGSISGVMTIFGYTGNSPTGATLPNGAGGYFGPSQGAKHTSLDPLFKKVILADWPWHGNRPTYEPRTRWHKPDSDERFINTLFGDGHADLMNWDKEKVDPLNGGNVTRPYDKSWKWW